MTLQCLDCLQGLCLYQLETSQVSFSSVWCLDHSSSNKVASLEDALAQNLDQPTDSAVSRADTGDTIASKKGLHQWCSPFQDALASSVSAVHHTYTPGIDGRGLLNFSNWHVLSLALSGICCLISNLKSFQTEWQRWWWWFARLLYPIMYAVLLEGIALYLLQSSRSRALGVISLT